MNIVVFYIYLKMLTCRAQFNIPSIKVILKKFLFVLFEDWWSFWYMNFLYHFIAFYRQTIFLNILLQNIYNIFPFFTKQLPIPVHNKKKGSIFPSRFFSFFFNHSFRFHFLLFETGSSHYFVDFGIFYLQLFLFFMIVYIWTNNLRYHG